MSQLQRVIVRIGLAAQVPALKLGELGMDTDTIVMRIGDETADPPKIMTTKSTGSFDYSSTDTVTFNKVQFAIGGGIGGVDLASLYANIGIVVSTGGGTFRQTTITSTDQSVIVSNGDGQSGNIDLRVSTDSIQSALGDIRNQLTQQADQIVQLQQERTNDNDSLLKLVQLTGVPEKATDLGTFIGNIIPDNSTIKTALQALSTAIQNSSTANFHLELTTRLSDSWSLQLTPDNIVTFESANDSQAGLMSGADKTKLDRITSNNPVNLDTFFTLPYTPDPDQISIGVSNGQTLTLFGATGNQAGVMSVADKSKLDLITVTQPINLDDLNTRVTNLENNESTAFLIETGTQIWQSSADQTTYTIDLNAIAGMIAFSVKYDRVTQGSLVKYYDNIVLNGVTIVEDENVTKSYTGEVVIFKARNNAWYYLNKYNVGVQLAPNTATTMLIDIGTSNSVTLTQLTVA